MTKKTNTHLPLLCLMAVLVWIAASWGEMIFIGVLHDQWWNLMPAMSYKVALIITGIIMLARCAGAFIATFLKELYG